MQDGIQALVLELAEQAGPKGISMGHIVDQLAGAGHQTDAVERAIWELLGRRRLTPVGYVRRVLRRRGDNDRLISSRSYEFLLIPWSADLDKQLEIAWGDKQT